MMKTLRYSLYIVVAFSLIIVALAFMFPIFTPTILTNRNELQEVPELSGRYFSMALDEILDDYGEFHFHLNDRIFVWIGLEMRGDHKAKYTTMAASLAAKKFPDYSLPEGFEFISHQEFFPFDPFSYYSEEGIGGTSEPGCEQSE
jgi:hypothetical protein